MKNLSNFLRREVVALFFLTTKFLSSNTQDNRQARFPKGRSIVG